MDKKEKLRAQTLARQAAYRKRLADAGSSEIRGIYAPQDLHESIKKAIREILETKG